MSKTDEKTTTLIKMITRGMKILITGDRNFSSLGKKIIENLFQQLKEKDVMIIHGHCPSGADHYADTCANNLKIPVKRYPANWKKYGKAAGPIRNRQMIEIEKPNVVFAFHDKIEASKGTKDTVNCSIKSKIPTFLFDSLGHIKQLF